MSLYRHLRLAPLLALGSWFFTTHCSDPLADDCRRTLTCNEESQGSYTLDPDCVWRNPNGTVWREGPHRVGNDWYWNDGSPVGRRFVCGAGEGINAGGSGGAGGEGGGGTGGAGGAGGDGTPDAGIEPEPPPPTPDCNTPNLVCTPPTECDPGTGDCVGCVTDEPCAGTIAPRCSQGSCVACIDHTDCTTPGFSRCDSTTNTCQPCTDNAQCEGGALCNTTLNGGTCVQCLAEEQCTALTDTPQCKEETGVCVRCTADEQCANDRDNAHCDLGTNTCVPCTTGEQCPDATPICDIDGATARCVACTGNDGPAITCQNEALANCNASGDCVGCTANNQCTHLPGNRDVCNTSNGICVQCVNDDDCDAVGASRCDTTTNTCVECTRNGATSIGCGGAQQGGTVCDTSFNPNRCVQCTGEIFTACAGGANVCDSRNRTCTQFPAAATGFCGTCVSDAQCVAGQVCQAQTFGATNLGFFCFPLATGTPQAPVCAGSETDFRVVNTTPSIDGNAAASCALSSLATCPARDDLGAMCSVANDCGATGVDDGLCLAESTISATLRCTVPCVVPEDCRTGSACNTQVSPVRCTF